MSKLDDELDKALSKAKKKTQEARNKTDDYQPLKYRMKIIKISPLSLASLLMENNKAEVVKGLPAGTKFMGAGFDAGTNQIFIHVENKRFPEVEVGEKLPVMDIELRRIVEIEDLESE